MRQFVLHGLPTTRTRTSTAAFFLHGLPLANEDFPVNPQQILTFHAGFARDAANQQSPVHPFETLIKAGRRHDALEQGKGAIIQFHDHAVEGRQSRFDFDQVQKDRLVRPKDSP